MTRFFYLVLFVLILSACSPNLTPFTKELYDRTNLTETELKRTQFWLSSDIVLQRVISGSATQNEEGEIKVVDGQKIDEVILPKGTPGVFVHSPDNKRFAIAFEGGADDRFLMFGPSPKARNNYVLLAKKWNRNYGEVSYDGKLYRVNASSAYAALMVDLKKVDRTIRDSRVASGIKVSN